jgi:hypothetical protein
MKTTTPRLCDLLNHAFRDGIWLGIPIGMLIGALICWIF